MVSLPKRSFVTELEDGLTADVPARTTGKPDRSRVRGGPPSRSPRHACAAGFSFGDQVGLLPAPRVGFDVGKGF